jgi:hypothetical protein
MELAPSWRTNPSPVPQEREPETQLLQGLGEFAAAGRQPLGFQSVRQKSEWLGERLSNRCIVGLQGLIQSVNQTNRASLQRGTPLHFPDFRATKFVTGRGPLPKENMT